MNKEITPVQAINILRSNWNHEESHTGQKYLRINLETTASIIRLIKSMQTEIIKLNMKEK